MTFYRTTEEMGDAFREDEEVYEAVEHWVERRLQLANHKTCNEELIERLEFLLAYHQTQKPEVEPDEMFLRKEAREGELVS